MMSPLSLKRFRKKPEGVNEYLNFAILAEDGIVLCKDGSFMAGFRYRGMDLTSATDDERNYQANRLNTLLSRLGGQWLVHFEAVRLPSYHYPPVEASFFPCEIAQLIDQERREMFEQEHHHYETAHYLIVNYRPAIEESEGLVRLFFEQDTFTSPQPEASYALACFKKGLEDLEDSLKDILHLKRLRSYDHNPGYLRDELVDFLVYATNGQRGPTNLPPHDVSMFVDYFISSEDLRVGDVLKIGDKYVACVHIQGFPSHSHPHILACLESLPFEYRWSTRMIYLDRHEAIEELESVRRKWRQKMRSFWAQVFRFQGGYVNQDAADMASEVETAIDAANSDMVAYGYYTSVVVLMHEDYGQLMENARAVCRELTRNGFKGRVETLNTMEAWLGSIPGHSFANIRQALVHTFNLAHIIPTTNIWAGEATSPCPYFRQGSPPLLYAATSGSTPFRLNLHVGDVGHTLVFGPTGAGKSTLLGILAAQFLRHQNATIAAFDKGESMWTLVNACEGQHYAVGGDDCQLSFCPLGVLDSPTDLAWAEEWIASCYQLQTGTPPNPSQRAEIHRVMALFQTNKQPGERSITDFLYTLQDSELREALSFYSLEGPAGHLLDAREDGLSTSFFTVFEVEELMAMGDKTAIPVLLYLFRRVEKMLKGQPALLILDEAWIMLGHPVFREKIREWLKVLRKANCSVVLATQSLSDAIRSGIYDVLIESCPTKILLPNEEADKTGTATHPGPRDLYTMMGLNENEIDLLKNSVKKRHYYYAAPVGRRLFDLGLGPIALSFVGVSDKATLKSLKRMVRDYGHKWPWLWLQQQGVFGKPPKPSPIMSNI